MPMTYMFIDESGDPSFYASGKKCLVGTDGFKPLLLFGMLKITDKKAIRNSILEFSNSIKSDPLYNTAKCINKSPDWFLHASYDNIEIQVKFIDFLRRLEGFKFYCVIGRKRLDVFSSKHNNNETEFYFDIVKHLLKDRLNDHEEFFQVYLAKRHKSTQLKLKEAIELAISRDNLKRKTPIAIKYNCEIVLSKDTPELSIVDYLLWALQRYILKNESRFYEVLKEKYNLIIDLYDFDNYKTNHYHSKNRFSLEKAGKFRNDGYV